MIKLYLTVFIFTLFLSACGLKGPLYWPNDSQESLQNTTEENANQVSANLSTQSMNYYSTNQVI